MGLIFRALVSPSRFVFLRHKCVQSTKGERKNASIVCSDVTCLLRGARMRVVFCDLRLFLGFSLLMQELFAVFFFSSMKRSLNGSWRHLLSRNFKKESRANALLSASVTYC